MYQPRTQWTMEKACASSTHALVHAFGKMGEWAHTKHVPGWSWPAKTFLLQNRVQMVSRWLRDSVANNVAHRVVAGTEHARFLRPMNPNSQPHNDNIPKINPHKKSKRLNHDDTSTNSHTCIVSGLLDFILGLVDVFHLSITLFQNDPMSQRIFAVPLRPRLRLPVSKQLTQNNKMPFWIWRLQVQIWIQTTRSRMCWC